MQGWAATMRHEVTKKKKERKTKRFYIYIYIKNPHKNNTTWYKTKTD